MAKGPMSPTAWPEAPIKQPATVSSTQEDLVPLTMRCWRDVGDRMAHIPAGVRWTDWMPQPDWNLPRPNLQSVSMIALGLYEFVNRTKGSQAAFMLGSPYVAAALHVAAERRFIAWKQVHAELRATFETYQTAVRGAQSTSEERAVYEDVFPRVPEERARLGKLVSGCISAVSGAAALAVVPGVPATDFSDPPRAVGIKCVGPQSRHPPAPSSCGHNAGRGHVQLVPLSATRGDALCHVHLPGGRDFSD